MATGSAAEIEEERRLLYVAMTRARDRLDLLVPQRFYVQQQSRYGDRHVYATLSRFIPPEVAARFDAVTTTPPGETLAPLTGPAPAPIDIAGRIRSRWA